MVVCVWDVTFDFWLFHVSCDLLVIGHLKWCLVHLFFGGGNLSNHCVMSKVYIR